MRSLLLKISSLPSNIKWITAGLILILLSLLTLIYLNILPLYKFLPAMFQPFSPTPTKVIINCPVPQKFCQKARPIIYQGKSLGLGFVLLPGTPIVAAFPGIIKEGKNDITIKIKPHPILALEGKDLPERSFAGFTANYNFFGVPISSNSAEPIKLFTQGSIIASASAESFPTTEPFNGINFIFSVFKEGQPVDFEFK